MPGIRTRSKNINAFRAFDTKSIDVTSYPWNIIEFTDDEEMLKFNNIMYGDELHRIEIFAAGFYRQYDQKVVGDNPSDMVFCDLFAGTCIVGLISKHELAK